MSDVAVLGPGGVGGLLGALLAREGARVTCLAGPSTVAVSTNPAGGARTWRTTRQPSLRNLRKMSRIFINKPQRPSAPRCRGTA